MFLRLLENASMRHDMRHPNRTVAESTLFATNATPEKESVIIQAVRALAVACGQFVSSCFHRGMYRFGGLGQNPQRAPARPSLGKGASEGVVLHWP